MIFTDAVVALLMLDKNLRRGTSNTDAHEE